MRLNRRGKKLVTCLIEQRVEFPASNHQPMGSAMEKLVILEDYRQKRSAGKSKVNASVPSKGAEILLFTGIQVEYTETSIVAPSPSPFARQS